LEKILIAAASGYLGRNHLAAEEGKEIIAMRFKNMTSAATPNVLTEHGVVPFDWDVDKLFKKLGG